MATKTLQNCCVNMAATNKHNNINGPRNVAPRSRSINGVQGSNPPSLARRSFRGRNIFFVILRM